MVVIMTVTMLWMIWLLLVIKINDRHMKECPGSLYLSKFLRNLFQRYLIQYS